MIDYVHRLGLAFIVEIRKSLQLA